MKINTPFQNLVKGLTYEEAKKAALMYTVLSLAGTLVVLLFLTVTKLLDPLWFFVGYVSTFSVTTFGVWLAAWRLRGQK